MGSLEVVSIQGLLLLFAKASLVVIVVNYLAGQFRHSPAVVRHKFWVGLLLTLAILPVWTWLAPTLPVPLLPSGPALLPASWTTALVYVYLLVVLCRCLVLLANIAHMGFISMRSRPVEPGWREALAALAPNGRVALRASADLDSPVTWGVLHPLILVPANTPISDAEKRMVLLHELQHIRRCDWLTQLLGRLVSILFWPVPGMRPALARLSLEAEQACDDCVLHIEGKAPDYAALLLRQARARYLPAAVALGQSSELALRVRNLCEPTVDHSHATTYRFWLVPLCIALALPLASLQLAERQAVANTSAAMTSIRLGQWIEAAEPVSEQPIKMPDRPLEVNRAPQLSYVFAPETYQLPAADPGLQQDSRPPGKIEVASIGLWRAAPRTTPRYPERAARRGLEGDVTVVYDLLADGRISNLRITDAHPPGVFEDSVYQALATDQDDEGDVVLRNLESVFRFRLRNTRARASPD